MGLPQHHQPVTIRYACGEADVLGAKRVARSCSEELGFVNLAALREAASKHWLLVAVEHEPKGAGFAERVVGFVNFRIRQDKTCTLYEIATERAVRGRGVGKRLLAALVRRAHEEACSLVRLKCPVGLPSNNFYLERGFQPVRCELGKKRALNVWHYELPLNQSIQSHQELAPQPHFFASLTVKPDEVRKLHCLWHQHAHGFDWPHGAPNPFRRVLISPVVTPEKTFRFVREMHETGETEEVMFDSGGYFVQKGDLAYYDLQHQLYSLYREHSWAAHYVLPDNPPLSADSQEGVDAKVRQTVEGSLRLLHDLPTHVQEKAIPVVHGTQREHLDYCLRRYLDSGVGFSRIGFGSFPTSGSNNSINRLSAPALLLVKELAGVLREHRVGVHSFGISTPPAIYLLSLAGVASFDSNGWMRSGGYGLVFLPFMRGHLVTFNSRSQSALSETDFQQWKSESGHDCPFCDTFDTLSKKRWHRIMHNLTVMAELETHQRHPRLDMMQALSRDYYRIHQHLTLN